MAKAFAEPSGPYRNGVRDALALIDAIAAGIGARPEAQDFRQRVAAEVLREAADGIRAALILDPPEPVHLALRAIGEIEGAEGEIECPQCAGRLQWTRSDVNGHVWGACETPRCLRWMQ